MTAVLLLAGTAEAAELAVELHDRGPIRVTTSFAGRTRTHAALPGPVRVGGFGGVDGLATALLEGGYDQLVDATHPFAAQMPRHAAAAAGRAGIPRLRLVRPAWAPVHGDRWHDAADLADAARVVRAIGARRVLLTTGRLELAPFADLPGVQLVTRSIEPPDPSVLPGATVVLARGPFSVDDELALLREHRIDAVVAKNSGGTATAAKLVAARATATPIVMVRRPPVPPGPRVATVAEAVAWVLGGGSVRPVPGSPA